MPDAIATERAYGRTWRATIRSTGRMKPRVHAMLAVTVLLALAATFFMVDVLSELPQVAHDPVHPILELMVTVMLGVGTVLGLREMRRMARDNHRMARGLKAAQGGFLELLEESFARWGLTPAERDVALLTVKGLTIAEIAALRGSRGGTVKAQSAAIYRKAGVGSRAQLLALLVEELLEGIPVMRPQPAGSPTL